MKTRLAFVAVALALVAPARGETPEDRLARGIRQVDEGDFQAAVTTLEGVARELAADKSRSKELARAYVYMAMAYVGLSQETAAKTKFLEAWRNDAALKLSPREFPPRVIQAFEQAVREARSLPIDPGLVTAFLGATRADDVAELRRMLQKSPGLLAAREVGSGATALHWAALGGHTLSIAFLVGAGADLGATNGSLETPADVARRASRPELVPWLQEPAAGPPPRPGEAVEASKRGDVGRLRLILAADPAAIGQRDVEFGATPLHWAALRGYSATVAFLVGAGGDAAAKNASGETPLVVAQRAGRAQVADMLLP